VLAFAIHANAYKYAQIQKKIHFQIIERVTFGHSMKSNYQVHQQI